MVNINSNDDSEEVDPIPPQSEQEAYRAGFNDFPENKNLYDPISQQPEREAYDAGFEDANIADLDN